MSKLTSGNFLSLEDDLDFEKKGIGGKKVTLMKNDGAILENMEISEDVASEVSEDAPKDSSADVSMRNVQNFISVSSSSIPSSD